MRLLHILRSRLRSLLFPGRREDDLREELQFHLQRETERLEAAGLRPDTARQQALGTFGAVEPTKEACRDTRGLSAFDNATRDIRDAFRALFRAPLAALTIVTTVGLGLGLVAAVFTLLNASIFRVDEVRNPHELFRVDRQPSDDAGAGTFTRTQYDALVRETAVFSGTFATTPDFDAHVDGRRMEGRLVTGSFFGVLGVSAARGRALTPRDDEPGVPPVIVLSRRAWDHYFASDPGLFDRTIRVNDTAFQVIGVMPEDFRGLEVMAPDFWAPLSQLESLRADRAGADRPVGLHIVGRLAPGVSSGQALAQLRAWDARQADERPDESRTPALVLEPSPGTVPLTTDILVMYVPLFFAFGLILLIGCANVANLLLARGVARQREIGIRLAIGASRRRIISQLLTESLLLALLAAALGFGISRLALTAAVYAATSTFPPEIGNFRAAVPPADWRVALFLVSGAMASTLVFALLPALQSTRLDLVRAIHGEVVRDSRSGRARDILVGLQVTGAALLLICAAVFLRSSQRASSADPGIRTDGVVNVAVLSEQRRATILDSMRRDPSVVAIGAGWPAMPEGLVGVPAFAEGAAGRSAVSYRLASPESFDVLDIDLVRGRGFTPSETSAASAVAIVSERVARDLWPGTDAVGQVLRLEPAPSQPQAPDGPALLSRSLVVVGIARDVELRIFGVRVPGAGVYVPTNVHLPGMTLTLRVQGDAERLRQTIADRLAAIDPNMVEVTTLGAIARAEAYLLGASFWMTLVLGVLALALTLSGLFSVLSYLVQQRTREIGVRMALGATSGRIGALVLSQLARPVGIGLLLAATLTAALGVLLLATPAAEAIGASVRLFDPLAYGGSLLCIVAACAAAGLIPALRAGRVDPVGVLRQD